MEGSDEVWRFFQEFKDKKNNHKHNETISLDLYSLDKKDFQKELNSFYYKLFIEKCPKAYIDSDYLLEFDNIYRAIIHVYERAIKAGYEKIGLVEKYVNLILEKKPSIIGFSFHDKFDFFSREIRRKLKGKLPNIPIIIGGPFSSYLDRKKLRSFFAQEVFDFLIIGAGEIALPKLIKSLCSNNQPEKIENVCYLNKGQVIINNVSTIPDLNKLPIPDFTQLKLDLYMAPFRILPLQSARGCSYRKCTFCSHYYVNLNEYKTCTSDKVADIIIYLRKKYDCNYFVFHDDELPSSRIRKLCESFNKKQIKNVFFQGNVRLIDGFNNDSLLKLMKDSGFKALQWGVESGSQKIINLMKKGTNVTLSEDILKKCHENGFINMCFIMFGFPGETRDDAMKTVSFLKRNAAYIHLVMSGIFKLGKHSPIYDNCEQYGLEVTGENNYRVKLGMQLKEVEKFYAKFLGEVLFNNIQITAPIYRYINFSGLLGRMQALAIGSHDPISCRKAKHLIHHGKFNDLFPVILGGIKKDNNKIGFFPKDVSKSHFLNILLPPQNRSLKEIEENVIKLSDGTKSIREIINIISGSSREDSKTNAIEIINFLGIIFSNNWSFVFQKRWEWGRTSVPRTYT